MSQSESRLLTRLMAAQRTPTREPELRDRDGAVLRIQWDPEPGVQARAFLTPLASGERPYATMYDAQAERPKDYPRDFPFVVGEAVTVVHRAGQPQTTAGYWSAAGQTARVTEQLVSESARAGWTSSSITLGPNTSSADVQIVELLRGQDRRFLMTISGHDEDMVSLFDNPREVLRPAT
jgi:hypothetical protein